MSENNQTLMCGSWGRYSVQIKARHKVYGYAYSGCLLDAFTLIKVLFCKLPAQIMDSHADLHVSYLRWSNCKTKLILSAFPTVNWQRLWQWFAYVYAHFVAIIIIRI